MTHRRSLAAVLALIGTVAALAGPSVGRPRAPWFPVPDDAAIDRLLARMTLRDKVAQMFMVGPMGRAGWMPRHAKRIVGDLAVGGVFLQPLKNMPLGDAAETATVVRRFAELAAGHDPAIPPLFGLDQEGGIPQAFQGLFGGTDTPGNMGLGAIGDPETTRTAYAVMGRELRAIGANVALAPTLDVMTGPALRPMYTRCFGETADAVAAHGAAAVRGFQESGVVACIKHFPGGGGAIDDPHYAPAATTETDAEIRARHLPPFAAALVAGADMVMTGAIRFPGIEPGIPATLSRKIKVDLLRRELGFDGVVLTDDLTMGAFTGRSELNARVKPVADWGDDINVVAIRTGSDMLLYVDGTDAGRVAGMIDAVVRAVADGRLPESRIDQSVRRILRLKRKVGLFDAPPVDPAAADRIAGNAEHRRAMKEAHARALTLVRNDAGLWPLDPLGRERLLVISPLALMFRDPGSTFANATGTTLGKQVRRVRPDAEVVHFMPGGLNFLMDRAVWAAERSDADVIVLGLANAHYDPPQAEMARRVLALGKPVVVVSLATPYDLLEVPGATTFVCAYSFRTLALETAAEALFGRIAATGRLPVALPGLHPAGFSALREGTGRQR
jgi:beta-N-acetylhexosaminidase